MIEYHMNQRNIIMPKFKRVFFTGGPCSGKGTIIKLLIKNYVYLQHVPIGEILRESQQNSSVNKEINNGRLGDNGFVFNIVDKAVKNTNNQYVIIDGFPRTVDQVKQLVQYTNNYNIQVIYLDVQTKTMLERIQKRSEDIWPARADDLNKNANNERIKIFCEQTLPAIKLLKLVAKHNIIQFSKVNSECKLEEGYKQVRKALGLLTPGEYNQNSRQ